MHLCFYMLNTGRRKVNTTTTHLSPFTHNDSKLFTLISNDVTKPTVHNTRQFRVPQFAQNVALNVDSNNGWKQYKRERMKSMCVRGGQRGGRGRAGVYSVVNADYALGFSPFPQTQR